VILVCDDDIMFKRKIRKMFSQISPDHEVIDTCSCFSLIDLLHDCERHNDFPEVVLIDMMMPVKTGIECIDIVRKRFPSIPCIAMSTSMSERLMRETYAHGFNALLHKTLNNDDLNEQLSAIDKMWLQRPMPSWRAKKYKTETQRVERRGNHRLGKNRTMDIDNKGSN